jgi:hypothetical protein
MALPDAGGRPTRLMPSLRGRDVVHATCIFSGYEAPPPTGQDNPRQGRICNVDASI